MNNNKSQVHHFNVEDAKMYGVDKAVILSNLRFWLNLNKIKDVKANKHDGYYWVYNTAKDLSDLLPYFTKSKVQRLLKQLEDDGVILVGNYNKVKYDRTRWYSMPEYSINDNCLIQNPNMNNGNSKSVEPIPDTKTNTNTNIKTNTPDAVILPVDKFVESKSVNIPFSDFWSLYDYKKGKPKDVEIKWDSLTDEERTLIITNLPKYILSTSDKTYRKYPMSYLNTEAWLDEVVLPSGILPVNETDRYNSPISNSGVFTTDEDYNGLGCSTGDSSVHNKIFLEHSKRANYNIKPNKEVSPVFSASFNEFSEDVITGSSNIHWYELAKQGKLKDVVNPDAISENSPVSKSVEDFFANFGSKNKAKIPT